MSKVLGVVLVIVCGMFIYVNVRDIIAKIKEKKQANKDKTDIKGGDDQTLQNK